MKYAVILSKFKEPFQKKGFLRNSLLKFKLPVSFPLTLTIEPTNRCNLKCITCPGLKRRAGDMDMELFRSTIDQSLLHGRRLMITLHKDGESTLHPNLPDMVAYAKTHNSTHLTTFNTNGVSLNQQLAKKLILAGLDEIIFSLDAFDAETYRKLKGRDVFDQVKANILSFVKTRTSLNRSNPVIKVQILANLNILEGELPRFTRYWKKKVDIVRVDAFNTWGGAVSNQLGKLKIPLQRYPCQFLWYTMAINWDGRVSRCIYDWKADEPMGDLSKSTIYEIWNGEVFSNLRREHLNGHYPGICSQCTSWAEADNMGSWLEKKGTTWE